MELAPDVYQFLKNLKPIALVYAAVLSIVIILSIFFQWKIIKIFIDSLMGWTLLSIPFVGVLVVTLDKEFHIKEDEYTIRGHHKEKLYKFSMVWGVALCLMGIIGLYLSNNYKRYYSFQCQEFYLEPTTGIYHIFDDCEYRGNKADKEFEDYFILSKVSGIDLIDSNHTLCEACKERAEDMDAEIGSYQYFKRP